MKDQYGRTIDYLRISITDACNLRCRYCMPERPECLKSQKEGEEKAPFLSEKEILRVVQAAGNLGISHYRITGGEPLVRSDCVKLIQEMKEVPGVQSVGITTNGVRLAANAETLKKAGCDSVNVSLDTVDRAEFADLTGADCLEDVKQGIREAKKAGLFVKINTVHRKELDARAILEFAGRENIPVRFIEMMPVGAGKCYVGSSNEMLKKELEQWYGRRTPEKNKEGCGPAVYERYEKLPIPVGMISAIHGKFCPDCNRIRLTSHGFLKLCLCYENGVDLREVLRNETAEELEKVIAQAIWNKPIEHCFERPKDMTEHHLMSGIGG